MITQCCWRDGTLLLWCHRVFSSAKIAVSHGKICDKALWAELGQLGHVLALGELVKLKPSEYLLP
jgi:hypothetical protein